MELTLNSARSLRHCPGEIQRKSLIIMRSLESGQQQRNLRREIPNHAGDHSAVEKPDDECAAAVPLQHQQIARVKRDKLVLGLVDMVVIGCCHRALLGDVCSARAGAAWSLREVFRSW